jgi:exopolyphosphatase / guanosine-5'-triphosphate,3'-diphosphate pyrophosphatase
MPDKYRVAAFDIGTNTALCLVLESQDEAAAKVVADRHAIARLGEGVDKTHIISDAAYNRFVSVMKEHLLALSTMDVDEIIAIGTSALRDAANRENILYRAKNDLDIDIKIISGSKEAELTYRGALAGMKMSEETVAVLDIGGGSTEIAIGTHGLFLNGQSVDVGAVRMTERYFSKPAPHDVAEGRQEIRRLIIESVSEPPKEIPFVAVAGTPTSLAAMELGLKTFDAALVQGHQLQRDVVSQFIQEMAVTGIEEMMQRYPVIAKGRADILLAGSLILLEVMELFEIEYVTVSTRGLRYGIAIDALEQHFALALRSWEIIV